ncbi:FK506-bp2 [Symbiodinium sp. CCMP2592]|nr:FK506-bp2 [Symbiodinium sp. CCMP2592]
MALHLQPGWPRLREHPAASGPRRRLDEAPRTIPAASALCLVSATKACTGALRLRRCRTQRCAARRDGRCTLLFLDPCRADLAERLEDRSCTVEHRGADEAVPEALRRVSPEIVVVRSSVVKEPQLETAQSGLDNLRLVMRAGAGVDNLAVPVLAERGVVVANAAGANAIAVAEPG